MKKNRLLFRVIILLILCGAVGFTLYQGFFADKEKMQIGKEAPLKQHCLNLPFFYLIF
ncbi:thiol-disulfide oxidoreductase resA [Bacillus cereus]|nr:thiol-disulfide oxidoreductase resA [Bacillus cereus]